jgi:DNA-binding NtrC family response regulator
MTHWSKVSPQLRPRQNGKQEVPLLLFRHRDRDMFILPLSRHRFRVGRAPSCDLRLPDSDQRLSREHFILEQRAAGLVVRDCSTNGTSCNGVELRGGTSPLRSGDRVRAGAWEMIFDPNLSSSKAAGSAPHWSDSTRRIELPGASPANPVTGFHGMLGDSEVMLEVYKMVQRLAKFDLPVLVQGESGTGKELVAQALHRCSPRARKPLVALNCAAIQPSMASSTLFGHEKGAFTGAAQRHPGVFEQAAGGTLFLDEIADLSPELQASLLRVLETSTVRPLGANKVLPVSFRLVTATHRRLRREVSAGRFREDLFYRIGVTAVDLPALRERTRDIPALAGHLLAQHAGDARVELAPDAMFLLQQQPWPGNVRELRNVLLRALVLSDGGPIRAQHLGLGDRCRDAVAESAGPAHHPPGQQAWQQVPPAQLSAEQQRTQLLHALHSCRGNRSRAATLVGISRSTLYARMKRLGMTRCDE